MPIKKFNTKAGLSVGPSRIDVIDANANATFDVVTATSFTGDGGNLSNIAGANVIGQVANALVAGTVYNPSQPNITSIGTLASLAVTGNIAAGNMSLSGSLTLPSGANIAANNITATSDITATGNVNAGNVNATGGVFTYVTGNGANLAAITGANVTGQVGFAGVANSVSGANVIGTVANSTHAVSATTATTANAVAGANVSGQVGFAAVANSVSGANVTGAVAFATTANAVAGSNVSGQVANALVAGTVYTAAQPNITSLGTLTSLTVTGNVNSGNVNATGGLFTYVTGNGANLTAIPGANVTGTVPSATVAASANSVAGANVTGAVAFATTANAVAGANVSGQVGFAAVANSVAAANVTGQVANALVAGTVYMAAQPNITSVGTLTSLAVTGNTTAANFVGNLVGGTATGTTATFTGAVTGATLSSTGNTAVGGNLTVAANATITGNAAVTGNVVATGDVQATGAFIGNALTTRTGPLTLTATGTNNIVLATGTGNVVLTPSTHITNLSDPVNAQDAATKVYVDALAQGLKPKAAAQCATTGDITLASPPAIIDGFTIVTGSRVLVRAQTATQENGIYTYDGTGLVRSTDADTVADLPSGTFVFVEYGATYGSSGFVMTSTITTLGVDPIVFAQFSTGGSYTAGAGLLLTGSQFSVAASTVTAGSYGNGTHIPSFTVSPEGLITAAGATQVSANATTLAGTILNPSIITSSLTSVGTLGSLSVTGNANVGNIGAASGVFVEVAGSLITPAQPNITSTGTLTGLTVGGTTNLGPVANVTITGGTTGQVLTTNGSGVLSWSTAAGGVSNGTSNVSAPTVNGNVNTSVGGVANVFVVTSTGANVAGTMNVTGDTVISGALTVTGTLTGNITGANTANFAGSVTTNAQPNITSVGTLSSLSVTGNVDAGNVNATGGVFTYVNGNGANLSAITGANVVGNVTSAITANFANFAGNITQAAQANITSVGTLTGLTVGGATNLGPVANVTITGGTSGQVLQTNGSGVLAWATVGSGSLSNGTSGVSVPVVDGNVNTSVGGVANVLVVTTTGANVAGTANITGALDVGGVSTLGPVGNVRITGGTSGQVLQTNGSGVLSWATVGAGSLANGTSSVSVPVADGNVNTSVGGVANVFVVTSTGANVAGTMNVTGDTVIGGNLTVTGTMTGNITGANMANFAGSVTTNAQPNITSVGTLTSLSVSGNVNADNVNATGGVFTYVTGNGANLTAIPGANVTGAVAFATTANSVAGSNVSGQVANALVAGTVYTNAQPNITSVGTLTSLAVTGNIAGGNVTTAGNVVAVGNIQADTGFIGNSLSTRTGPLTLTATGTSNITLSVGTGNINLSTPTHITNLLDPVSAQDAATKIYVDALVQGLKPKEAVQCATNSNISLTGAPTIIDGYTLTTGDRVLVKAQTAQADNGIYTYDGANLTRSTDADTAAEIGNGTFVFVEYGSTFAGSGFVQTSDVVTLGTSPIVFSQFSTGGSYTAGAGLTLTGSQFSVASTGVTAGSYGNATHIPSFTVTSSGQLTAVSVNEVTSISNGTSNVSIPTLNGNVNTSVGGNTSFVVTDTGANVAGTLNVTTNSTTDAVRITQTGTGNAFVVEDAANPDSTPFIVDTNGRVGIGGAPGTAGYLTISAPITDAVTSGAVNVTGEIQSSVTTQARYFRTSASTAAASFTLPALNHYVATQGTFGAGSTVTSQYGFVVQPSLIGATNNYGFYGQIPAGTGRYNLFMNGTADNYMAGRLGVGALVGQDITLGLAKTMTGGTSVNGVFNSGTIQSDVTVGATYNTTLASTAAASFTLPELVHYNSSQGTFGAGSTVTNQYGFFARETLIGATNNYGFYSAIPNATGRWSFYAAGTAPSYFGGDVTAAANLAVTGTTNLGPVTNVTITGGTTGQAIVTNGSGVLSFATVGDVTLTGTQTLTNKTLTAPTVTGAVLNDGYTEEVFVVSGTTPALSPTNGSIQTWALSGASTPTAGTWASGQSMTLMIDDGTASTISWTTLAPVWETNGGTAPTLATTGYTVITLWKVDTTIYAARVGDA